LQLKIYNFAGLYFWLSLMTGLRSNEARGDYTYLLLSDAGSSDTAVPNALSMLMLMKEFNALS